MFKLECITLKFQRISKIFSILKYFSLLMCLKDLVESKIKMEKSSEMDKTSDCPLCMEPLEFDDKNFYPCTCGYQVCRFCWHRIRVDENGLCPACRRTYPENPANFQPLTPEELQRVKQQKKMKVLQTKQKVAESRKQLANIRVIQKNLVFAVGLPLELSQDNQKKEKVLQMFRQFGPTHKEAITDRTTYAGSQGPSACVYITYQKAEDAVRAVKSLANTKMEGRTIKVSLGTTKYCSNFLKNIQCPKAECLYLHEIADEEASFTKEDIHLGKHLEYEQKLLEQTLSALQNKAHSQSNETNRTNNRNADNSSESSDDLPQNSSFYDSSEASELSPSSNCPTLENNRNIDLELNLETENNHQNLHSANSDLRNNPASSSNQVFRSETNIISNHSSNSNFQDSPLNSVNQGFSNQLQPKETEPLQQPYFLHNHIYENTLQNRGQSSSNVSESNILRLFSSTLPPSNNPTSSYSTVSNMRQEQINPLPKHKDEPELGFDPCQVSLNGLQDLISEEQEQIRIHSINKNSYSNKSSTLPAQFSDGFRSPFSQPSKVRDPPPGFSNNYPQSVVYKPSYETGNSVLNKAPVALHNQLGIRGNYPVQRYQQPGLSLNNSSFVDYSSQHVREVPDHNPPIFQQPNQRFMNVPQAQFPVTEQRSSPLWNVTHTHWRPENAFFNQSISESLASNDYNMRMQQLRPNEAAFRQAQWLNGNVNNLPPAADLPKAPMVQEQAVNLHPMMKAFEASQRSSSMGHRLQYTKKL